MNRYSTVIDRDESDRTAGEAYLGEEHMSSPFAGAVLTPPTDGGRRTGEGEDVGESGPGWLASPFAEGLVVDGGSEADEAFATLVAELEDEGFDEALQTLADEAAGRHLASSTAWSSEDSDRFAAGDVEAWMSGIATEADTLLEQVELHFASRTPESLLDGEVETVLTDALAARGHPGLDGEDFLGAIARKARSLAKGAVKLAKRGVAAVGRRLLGPLFRLLRKLVRPLLQRVLAVALNKLPLRYRADAAALAGKLGVRLPTAAPAGPIAPAAEPAAAPAGPATAPDAEPVAPGAALAELFDAELTRIVVADNERVAEQLQSEWESTAEEESEDGGPVARLDSARAELAAQLMEAEPGSVLTSQLEQFLPVVLVKALPLLRTGIRMIGRDKVVGLIAKPIAELIKGHVGPDATRALSRAIADKGLGLLTLEGETGGAGVLGAEALVSTVEDTMRSIAELPPESLREPLRVQAELQEAFAEAAARHLPSELLRPDLDAFELEGESAVWVLMPRGPSRRYRYRKFSTTFPASIGRRVARAIVLEDGGTLEERLLDEGAGGWPVEAEVHLYEALPGTHLGHLAAMEGERLENGELDTGEFEQLTPGTAALLINQPGLGRASAGAPSAGQRYFRIAVPRRGRGTSRRYARVVVRLVLTGPRPVLRVHLRLGEREALRIGELLAQRADVRLVAAFRALILGRVARSLPARLLRQAQRVPGMTLTPENATSLSAAFGERMLAAVAAQLRAMAPTLAAATRDPAPGVTLTFEFGFADRAALLAARPETPTLTVRPGRHRD